jgi:cobalt-zinc-cadmium efflux system outer membrane protein
LGQQRYNATEQAVRNRVIREVSSAYFDYSYWNLAEGTIKENLALIDATVSVTEERYATGRATAHDVLMAQTTASRLEIRLMNVRQSQQSALLELWRTVGDSSTTADLSPYLPEPSSDLTGPATIAANPYLLDANLAIDQARAKRSLSRSDYWPDITVGVDYLARKAVPGDMSPGEDWLSFHVGFSLPLWFGSKQKSRVRASEQLLLASQQQRRSVHDWLTKEAEDSKLNVRVLTENLNEYNEAILPQARASFDAAEIAYEVAEIDFDALLSSQVQLLDIQLERLDLLRQINQTRAILQELYGNSLER